MRRAQAGTQVAAVILVIALFMTLYILFIPPEEREELLGDQNRGSGTTTTTLSSGRVELLAESPGQLTPTTESANIHRIPSLNVFLKIEPRITTLVPSLVISNGLFSDSTPKLRFSTEDLDETNKVTLFFSVKEAEGELRIKVNGNTVFSDEIRDTGVKIIEMAKSNLREDNEAEFSVSSGILTTNKYKLEDVGIKQEFQRANVQEERTFSIGAAEKSSMTEARLKYFQICNSPLPNEFASLDIFLNERRIHSSEVRCITTEEELELDPGLILAGENELKFRLEEGDFSFTQIKVETETMEIDRPTFFFTLSQRQFEEIESGQRSINLHILLDQRGSKQARLLVNNNEIMMQTERNVFERDLRDFMVEGTNFIKIIPVNSFEMVGLKVILE